MQALQELRATVADTAQGPDTLRENMQRFLSALSVVKACARGQEEVRAGGSVNKEKPALNVSYRRGGSVVVGVDSVASYACYVKLSGDGAVQDVFFLRADEDPGRNFNNRISAYEMWRARTMSVPRFDGVTPQFIFQWCEAADSALMFG